MSLRSSVALYLLALAACSPEASGPAAPGRIIDVHLHTVPAEWTAETAPVNPVTGQRSAATTGADLLPQTISQMDEHRVEVAILSGPLESVHRGGASVTLATCGRVVHYHARRRHAGRVAFRETCLEETA